MCSVCNFILYPVEIAERAGNREVLIFVDPTYQIRTPVVFTSEVFERLSFFS